MVQTTAGYGILPSAVDSKRTTCVAGRYERVPPVNESSVQVGQAPPSTHAPLGEGQCAASFAKGQPAGPATAAQAQGTSGRTNRHRKFATVLGARSGDANALMATPAQAAYTLAPSRAIAAPLDPRNRARPAMAAQAPHRLLVVDGPGPDRAWLRIDGGRFAGTEIHLSLCGPRVEVCVLTPHEASRETLAIAMEAVRNRLRGRGLTMVESSPSPGSPPRQTRPRAGTANASTPLDASGDDEHGRPTS